jgi:hypothetical protein
MRRLSLPCKRITDYINEHFIRNINHSTTFTANSNHNENNHTPIMLNGSHVGAKKTKEEPL